jgi:hypothetical protein
MMNLTIDGMQGAIEAVAASSPQAMWRLDRDKARAEDRRLDRGMLILNPEILESQGIGEAVVVGGVVSHDGHEYRVHVDPELRGLRDKNGCVRAGFYLKTPPLLFPVTRIELQEQDPIGALWARMKGGQL